MKLIHALSAAATLFAGTAFADVVVTKDGSSISGKVVGIDDGKVTISTSFAGKITVAQDQVASISTDDPVYVTLESGATLLGPIEGDASGLTVRSDNGTLSTTIADVSEGWTPGNQSPTEKRAVERLKSLQRGWAYEATFDLTGKSGNTTSTGVGTSLRATLEGAEDSLQFYALANYETTENSAGLDTKSSDDFRGGVDYTNNFSDTLNWYVRAEAGYDNVKEIDQFFTAAAGLGRRLIDTEEQKLRVRAGLGYRRESYARGLDGDGEFTVLLRDDTNSASLDFGLFHNKRFDWGVLTNRLTYTPSIDDFGNYRIFHDSNVELPLTADAWKVRVGLSNTFDSEALEGNEKLDTTYYVRMVLNWK